MMNWIYYVVLLLAVSPPKFASRRVRDANLIENACGRTLDTSLCKSLLESEPQSRSFNLVKLTRVILTAATSNSSYIRDHIQEMILKDEKRDKKWLRDCYDRYRNAADQMEDSVTGVEYKGYEDVTTWVMAAMSDAELCEQGFRIRTGKESPVSAMNRIFTRLCSISLTFIGLLGHN